MLSKILLIGPAFPCQIRCLYLSNARISDMLLPWAKKNKNELCAATNTSFGCCQHLCTVRKMFVTHSGTSVLVVDSFQNS